MVKLLISSEAISNDITDDDTQSGRQKPVTTDLRKYSWCKF